MGPTLKSCNFAERHLGPFFVDVFVLERQTELLEYLKFPGALGAMKEMSLTILGFIL